MDGQERNRHMKYDPRIRIVHSRCSSYCLMSDMLSIFLALLRQQQPIPLLSLSLALHMFLFRRPTVEQLKNL